MVAVYHFRGHAYPAKQSATDADSRQRPTVTNAQCSRVIGPGNRSRDGRVWSYGARPVRQRLHLLVERQHRISVLPRHAPRPRYRPRCRRDDSGGVRVSQTVSHRRPAARFAWSQSRLKTAQRLGPTDEARRGARRAATTPLQRRKNGLLRNRHGRDASPPASSSDDFRPCVLSRPQ